MSRSFKVTGEAARELRDLAEWIRKDNSEAARRLIRSFESVRQRLIRLPGAAPLYRRPGGVGTDLRVFRVPGFPNHLIFYRWLGQEVRVVRILHAARNLPEALGLGQPPPDSR